MKLTAFPILSEFVCSVILCTTLASGAAFSEPLETTTATETVSLQQLFEHYQKTHPAFTSTEHRNRLAENSLSSIKSGNDWNFSINSRYFKRESSREISNSAGTLLEVSDYENSSHSIRLRKRLWDLGASVSISQSYRRYPNNLSEHDNDLSINFDMPLWRGRGGLNYKSSYDSMELSAKSTSLSVEDQRESLLGSLGARFVRWSHAEELHQIRKQHLEQLNQLKSRANREISQREQLYFKHAIQTNNQELALTHTRLNSIKEALSQYAQMPNISSASPSYDLYEIKTLPDVANKNAIHNTRIVQIVDIQGKILQNRIKVATDDLNPFLSLSLSQTYSGSDSEFDQSYDFDSESYSLMLRLNRPIENNSAKTRLESVKIQQQMQKDGEQNLELNLTAGLLDLTGQLKGLSTAMSSKNQELNTASELMENEISLFIKNKLDISIVLSTLNRFIESKLEYADMATEYQTRYLSYQTLTDQLWQPNKKPE